MATFFFDPDYLEPPTNSFEQGVKQRFIDCIKEMCSTPGPPFNTFVNLYNLKPILGTNTPWEKMLRETYAAISSKEQGELYAAAKCYAQTTKDNLLLAAVIEHQSFTPGTKGATVTINNNQSVNIFAILEKAGHSVDTAMILEAVLGKPVSFNESGGMLGDVSKETSAVERKLSALTVQR